MRAPFFALVVCLASIGARAEDAGSKPAADSGVISGVISAAPVPPQDDVLMRSGPNDMPDDLTSPSGDAGEVSFGWALVRTFVVLGVVVALAYLTLNVGLRRLMGIKSVPSGHSSVVQVLERLPLDQKRALFVVKAANEYLLLGAGEGSMSLLSKLSNDEVEKIQREKPKPTLSLSPFLQKLLSRRGPP